MLNMCTSVGLNIHFQFFWVYTYLGVELLGHLMILCLMFPCFPQHLQQVSKGQKEKKKSLPKLTLCPQGVTSITENLGLSARLLPALSLPAS